jgi:hypothetical protein
MYGRRPAPSVRFLRKMLESCHNREGGEQTAVGVGSPPALRSTGPPDQRLGGERVGADPYLVGSGPMIPCTCPPSSGRESLSRRGLLYVGDGKMGALETRAFIQAGGDAYRGPLSAVQRPPHGELPFASDRRGA